jgi:hypothetical protein
MNNSGVERWSLMSRRISILLILITSLLTACSTQQPEIAPIDFENGIYQFGDSFSLEQVPLSDGTYKRETEFGGESVAFVTHASGEIGQFSEAGVAILAHSAGGSGTFYRLGVYQYEGGVLVESAYLWLGDRVIVHHLGVQDGQIVLVMTRHGAGDPLCCPTEVVIQKIVEDDGILALESETLIGTAVGP